MFEFFRKGVASWFAGLLLALLIASFALWGIGDPMSTLGSSDVAEVGEEKISPNDFARSFESEWQQSQQRFGQSFTKELAIQFGFGTQVITRMAELKGYDVEAKNLGLRVTDEDLRAYITSIPAFQNADGSFNRVQFEQIARFQGNGISEFEETMRADIARQQLIDSIMNNIKAPEISTATLNKYITEKRVAEILTIPANTMTQIGEYTDEDIQKQYDDNNANYMAPEYRDVSYFELSANDYKDQFEIKEEEGIASYETRITEYTNEEKRGFIQMLLDDETSANVAYTELQNGKSFEEVIMDQTGEDASEYEFEAQGYTDITEVYGEEVAEQIFDLTVGQNTEVIETALGFYLFKSTTVTEGSSESYDDVKDAIISDLKDERALERLYEVTDSIEDELAAGAPLIEIADVLSLNLKQIKNVNSEGITPDGTASNDLPLIVDFLSQSFQAQIGDEPELLEGIANKFYMLSVDNIVDSKLRDIADVREAVIANWTQGRRDALATELATTITDQYSAEENADKLLADFQDIESNNLTVNTVTVDRENIENNVAANIHASIYNQDLGSIEMIPAADNDGFVLVRVTERIFGGDQDEAKLAQTIQSINGAYQSDIMGAFTGYLYKSLPITIHNEVVNSTLQVISDPAGL